MILATILAAFCIYKFARGRPLPASSSRPSCSTAACAVRSILEIAASSGTQARINNERFKTFHR